MASEHESAVEAWLDNKDTIEEMARIRVRFPKWDPFQVVMFAAAMEMLVMLEMPQMTVVDGEIPPPDRPDWLDTEDDDKGEAWRG